MRPPCRGCSERAEACHDRCPRYREFREDRDRRLEEKRIRVGCWEARHDAVEKAIRPITMKRKRSGR